MSRSARRGPLMQAYVLGQKPWRDTSRILEIFSRDQGRDGVFARAVRGPKSKLSAVLQPFRPVLLSLSGTGEAQWLASCESDGYVPELPPAALMSGFYLNELLLKLTVRHDPHPELYDAYLQALAQLRSGEAPHRPLRLFEKRLLQQVGYGLELETDAGGAPVSALRRYRFHPGEGLLPARDDDDAGLSGAAILSLAQDALLQDEDLKVARRLLAAALDHCLEGRPITTRAVARACQVAAAQVAKEMT